MEHNKILKLHEIPFETAERFKAVIEIEKGSNFKYEYDEKSSSFILDFVFTPDLVFSHAYGFIPGTLSGDGDTLDAFVLSSRALKQGDVVDVRVIGMIDLLDRGEEDFKIITVSLEDEAYQNVCDISQLGDQWTTDMKKFYQKLDEQKNKNTVIRGFRDASIAIAEIQRAHEAFI
ncbi:inorganic diphosphatase [Candidatus Uhrbacteria bacterium]|nr:inorganic diphosphatase [Candidatus Uhrbacteria bacterium]